MSNETDITTTAEAEVRPSSTPAAVAENGSAASDLTEPESEADSVAALQPERPQVPLKMAVEAVLLVLDEPQAARVIASAAEAPEAEVAQTLSALAAEYDSDQRGFELRQVAGGWRLYTRAACAHVVERFVLDGQQTRLTQAALETLAVVAYRQPVSRGRISNIRGVNVDGVMRTLLSRGLVAEAGTDASSGAVLYTTTDLFLERLGINDLTDLPALAPLLPDIELFDEDHEQLSS